jgi:AcrR family transcriptional regulator
VGSTLAVRRRRTAIESKALILDVAAERLREHGLEGLNITGVAAEAGISHATLIHHFGSVGGMRDELADKMTLALVRDLVEALDAQVPPETLIGNLFDALAAGGHAKLLAWRAIEGSDKPNDMNAVSELFSRLLRTTREVLGVDTDAQVRQVVYLVAVAAIGHGLAGDVLAGLLGMPDHEREAFPGWMNTKLS